MLKNDDDINLEDMGNPDDEEPIPAKRDVRIFDRKKEKEPSKKLEKEEDFEEDVFV